MKWLVRISCMAALGGTLAACGGGSGSTDPSALFPTESVDTVPSGTPVDLGAYFPFSNGDSWSYDVYDRGVGAYTSRVDVRIVSGPDAQGTYTVETRDDSTAASTTARYRRTSQGLFQLEPLSGVLTPRAAEIVGPILITPTPMTPIGAERSSLRRGSWGRDVDGDGVFDGFELGYRQTFGGFTTIDGAADVAYLESSIGLTLRPTRAGYVGNTSMITQREYLAPGLGTIRLEAETSNSLQPGYGQRRTLTLASAVIAGRAIPSTPTVVFATSAHADLAFDRAGERYLIALPTGQTHGPLILAFDPATLTTSVVKTLDGEPIAMAVDQQGQSLYVATEVGVVLRLALADFRETGRFVLPGPACAKRLVASPTRSDVLLAFTGVCSTGAPGSEIVLISDLAVVGGAYVAEKNLFAFAPDGTTVFVYHGTMFPQPTFVRLTAEPTGLRGLDAVAVDPGIAIDPDTDLEIGDNSIRLGHRIIDRQSWSVVGSLDNASGPCVRAAVTASWLCRPKAEPVRYLRSLSSYERTSRQLLNLVDYAFTFAASELSYETGIQMSSGRPGEVLVARRGIRQDPYEGNKPRSEYRLVRSDLLR